MRLSEIVAQLGGEQCGSSDPEITGVATLTAAGTGAISFLTNFRYLHEVQSSAASAFILPIGQAELSDKPRILSDNPHYYFARVVQIFHPQPALKPGIAVGADVAGVVPTSCQVAAKAIIAEGAVLGESVFVGAGSYIGRGVHIGANSHIGANVTIMDGSIIGLRAIIHPGVVIGADGFGFAAKLSGGWEKIPQIGRVCIGDDVEIGANTCIDRGAIDDTVIGNGVKLDNLIQIAHNVHLGDNTIIAAMSGVAGSARIGKNCIIGGKVTINGHIEICDATIISGATSVTKSITVAGVYTNTLPTMSNKQWLENFAHLRHLDKMATTIRELVKKKS